MPPEAERLHRFERSLSSSTAVPDLQARSFLLARFEGERQEPLSRRYRQCRDLAHYASKQPPRQMALREKPDGTETRTVWGELAWQLLRKEVTSSSLMRRRESAKERDLKRIVRENRA